MKEEHIKMLEQTKYLITQMTNMQELYFANLSEELGVGPIGENWLYDYIHNDHSDDSLESYLIRYGKSLQDIIDE